MGIVREVLVWFDGWMRRPLIPTLAVSAVLLFATAACGGDDSDSSATTTSTTIPSTTTVGPVTSASPELCEARDELRSSLSDLTNVNIVANGTTALTDALGEISDDLVDVRAAAGEDLQAQTDALQDSLSALQTAVENLASGGGQASAVITAVADVGSTGGTLLTSLGNLSCS